MQNAKCKLGEAIGWSPGLQDWLSAAPRLRVRLDWRSGGDVDPGLTRKHEGTKESLSIRIHAETRRGSRAGTRKCKVQGAKRKLGEAMGWRTDLQDCFSAAPRLRVRLDWRSGSDTDPGPTRKHEDTKGVKRGRKEKASHRFLRWHRFGSGSIGASGVICAPFWLGSMLLRVLRVWLVRESGTEVPVWKPLAERPGGRGRACGAAGEVLLPGFGWSGGAFGLGKGGIGVRENGGSWDGCYGITCKGLAGRGIPFRFTNGQEIVGLLSNRRVRHTWSKQATAN